MDWAPIARRRFSYHWRPDSLVTLVTLVASTDIGRCRELALDLVDSAVIATAERLDIRRVLTVDERDFRAVRPKGDALTLLPSDVDKK